MKRGLLKQDAIREKLVQLVADVNELNAIEGNGARPTTLTELKEYPLQSLMAWQRDIDRRRALAGLPEHART